MYSSIYLSIQMSACHIITIFCTNTHLVVEVRDINIENPDSEVMTSFIYSLFVEERSIVIFKTEYKRMRV